MNPRLARLLATAPMVPGGVRRAAAAGAARALTAAGRDTDAAELLGTAARRARGLDRVELAGLAADLRLRAGDVTGDATELVRSLLSAADRGLLDGDDALVVRLLSRVAALHFARAVHLDGPSSPLAEDPAAFLAPLRESTAWARLTRPRGRSEDARPRPDGPLRVLVVTDDDTRFADPLVGAVHDLDPTVDLRVLRLRSWAAARGLRLPLSPGEQVAARWPTASDAAWADRLADELADELAGIDVVWVEWCQRSAVILSLLDPGPRRVVVRLHSFEAFTVFPHLVDPSRVDTLVVVSPALAGLAAAAFPDLAQGLRIVSNVVADRGISVDKTPTAAQTVGLIGWAAPAKDAVWALDVLAALRGEDPRWRLRLVGSPPDPTGRAGEAAYARRVRARMAEPDVVGAVDEVGQVDDVATQLRDIGVVVSSSTRESFHLAVAEAVLSGALAVVRDWPALARFGGAHGVWPDSWIVTTPAQAAWRALDPDSERGGGLPVTTRTAAAFLAVLRGTTPTDDDLVPAAAPSGR